MLPIAMLNTILKYISIIIFWCGTIPTINAQEYNYWGGGVTNLTYTTEPPTYKRDYQRYKKGIDFVIADNQGKLKFKISANASYKLQGFNTDTVFTANDVVVGAISNVQSTVQQIVFRYNDSLYYIFYAGKEIGAKEMLHVYDTFNYSTRGLYYSYINTRASGGLGEVISPTNSLLHFPYTNVTAINATQNADSTWWVICRAADSLYAYKVTATGVSSPVVSYAKERTKPRVDYKYKVWSYKIKFSNDGETILFNTEYSPFFNEYTSPDTLEERVCAAYTFNKQTGKFSGQQILHYNAYNRLNSGRNSFLSFLDFTFSPNDSLIYAIFQDTLLVNGVETKIMQYLRHSSAIKSTGIEIFRQNSWETRYTFLELGQNGRIVATADQSPNGHYGYIYRPNVRGKGCQLIHNGFEVKCYHDVYPALEIQCSGMYQYFTRYHGNKMEFSSRAQCDSTVQMINQCDATKFTAYQWFIYGTAGNTFVDSAWGKEPNFKLPAEGRYWVKLRGTTHSGYRPWYSDTIEFKFLPVPKAAFAAKSNTGCRYVAFEFTDSSNDGGGVNPATGQTWVWNFGLGKDTVIHLPFGQTNTGKFFNTYTKTGIYPIRVKYDNGYCQDSFVFANTITIVDAPKPGITIDKNNTCQPAPISFKRKFADAIVSITYNFGDGSTPVTISPKDGIDELQNYTYSKSGVYAVTQTLEGVTGCVTKDTVTINIFQGFEANQIVHLTQVTLADSNKTSIMWEATDYADRYELYRSLDTLQWQKVGTVVTTDAEDRVLNTSQQVYYYRVEAYDTCEKDIKSNKGSTIVAKGENFDNQYAIVNWTPYLSWPNGVANYDIEIKDGKDWVVVNATSALDYKDNNFADGDGLKKCYRITAYENNGAGLSNSNEVCLPVAPVLWIPNAFSPDNNLLNEGFYITTMGIEKLSIKIYNANGEQVFSCNGIDCVWDGNYKGKAAPMGVYTYIVSARGTDKKSINTSGSITLIR